MHVTCFLSCNLPNLKFNNITLFLVCEVLVALHSLVYLPDSLAGFTYSLDQSLKNNNNKLPLKDGIENR